MQLGKDLGRSLIPNSLLKAQSVFNTDQAALGFVQPGLENLLKALWDIYDVLKVLWELLGHFLWIDSEKDYLRDTSTGKFLRNFLKDIIVTELQWCFSSLRNENRLTGSTVCVCFWSSVKLIGVVGETFC